MSKEPELGQLAFGAPTGNYGTEEWQDALIEYLLEEIDRVFWNVNQKMWEREDLEMKGFQFREYCWTDGPEADLPNLKFDFSPQEIRWYKHPGRGQSCMLKWDEKEWIKWFNEALKVIKKNDKSYE